MPRVMAQYNVSFPSVYRPCAAPCCSTRKSVAESLNPAGMRFGRETLFADYAKVV